MTKWEEIYEFISQRANLLNENNIVKIKANDHQPNRKVAQNMKTEFTEKEM